MAAEGAEAAASPPSADHEALTNTLRPLSDCFLTIRIIKSFTYRTSKNLLLPHVDVTKTTVGQLKDICRERACRRCRSRRVLSRLIEPVSAELKTAPGFKPFRTVQLGA